MGHDIVTIGRHTLATANIHTLANDIAQRLQANVIIQYLDDYSHYVDSQAEPTLDADAINIGFFKYTRWWDFCHHFTTENEWDKEFTGINHFRQNLKKAIHSFGGHEMVYLDDQGETGYLTYGDYSWQQITDALQTKFKGQVLNVSAFMKNKILRKDGDYPLAFYDDFSDLL